MQCGVSRVAPIRETLDGRRHQGSAAVVAIGDHQARGDIGPVLAPKEVDIPFEYRPKADIRLETAIIEQEGRARDAVCTDNTLVAVHCQQDA